MNSFQTAFSARSRQDPEAFWSEQAAGIHWHQLFDSICDYSRPPFAKWYSGGRTNLRHNARLPLPPGCLTTAWKNDTLFAEQYCSQFPGKLLYSTYDYAVQDEEGYFFILGRMDDVTNVAGHRIGTREIEEALCTHPAVAEAAADEIKHHVLKCFVVLKHPEHHPSEEACAALDHIREAHAVLAT